MINLNYTILDYYGEVHQQTTAVQIFNNAVSNGHHAGIVQQQ